MDNSIYAPTSTLIRVESVDGTMSCPETWLGADRLVQSPLYRECVLMVLRAGRYLCI